MKNKSKRWKPGSIIQIDPDYDELFGGCLMIVTEEKPWGAQGYFDVPGKGRAYYRCKHENGVLVGNAEWIFEASGIQL